MSDNTKVVTSRRCRGFIIPQYKRYEETFLDPLAESRGVKEYMTIIRNKEIGTICLDCNKNDCDSEAV